MCMYMCSHTHTHTHPHFLWVVSSDFHNSHGVILCVVREHAASIKQGVDFFSLHLPVHAYICSLTCFMHTHFLLQHTHAHTHRLTMISSNHFQLVPCIVVILRSKQYEWWTYSDRVLVLACLSTGITLQQCLLVCVCVCLCVYVCWNSFPFFSLIPFKAVGGKHWQIYWSTLDLKAICHVLG